MSESKTRGRQKIPIRLIGNKDDLLVSFSKRRVGIYKKASELSTLCGVDVGAIIFSPSGIPHAFFTPGFDSVVYGLDGGQDPYGRLVGVNSRFNIRELNARLDGTVEQLEREERREKELAGGEDAASEMGWWEVPADGLSLEEVKEQMEWFQSLKAQIKTRVHELESNDDYSPPPLPQQQQQDGDGGSHAAAKCFFAPPSLDGYDGGAGTSNAGEQFRFPPPPPPYFDVGGGSNLAADQYIFPPPLPLFDQSGGGGSDVYSFPPPSLNLFEQYLPPPSPAHGGADH